MLAVASSVLESLRRRAPSGLGLGDQDEARAKPLPLGSPFEDALPDGGLPRSGVIEIASPRGLGRATSFALAACASAQAEARRRGTDHTEGAWCAWIDPSATLFAPAAAAAGVDLTRLLVVRPPPELSARVAVRVAQSRAFAVTIVDVSGVPGASLGERLDRWSTVVRRLALAVEGSDNLLLLLTDGRASRSMPLPVAMRIELERRAVDRVALRVAKDRRGRITSPTVVSWGGRAAVASASAASDPTKARPSEELCSA